MAVPEDGTLPGGLREIQTAVVETVAVNDFVTRRGVPVGRFISAQVPSKRGRPWQHLLEAKGGSTSRHCQDVRQTHTSASHSIAESSMVRNQK